MLDFGWAELFLIMAVAVFVIGPKEIPGIMRGLGRIVRRLQYMRFALTRQFDDFMQDVDLEDMQREAAKRNGIGLDERLDDIEMMPQSEDSTKNGNKSDD